MLHFEASHSYGKTDNTGAVEILIGGKAQGDRPGCRSHLDFLHSATSIILDRLDRVIQTEVHDCSFQRA